MIEIDEVARRSNPGQGRVNGSLHRCHERHDGAIVGLIGRDVEDGDTLDRRDRIADLADDVGATPLGEIRNTFDELHWARVLAVGCW